MEAELVGVSEYLPFNLWLMNFLHGKGCGIMNNVVYQYNQSAISMDNNGRNYCTGNSIHMNNSYFVRYIVDKGEVKIKYCPTQMMLEDYFTKPLKGKVLKIFRDVIMGYKPISYLNSIPVSIKQSVGNNVENS